MKRTIKVENAEYIFDDAATLNTEEGKSISFVSIQKVKKMKAGKPKFQNLTCSLKSWPVLRDFLLKCLSDSRV